MTSYQTAMAQGCRALHIRATMTLLTGYAYPLTDSDVVSFTLSEGVSGGAVLLGSAVSAHCTLTLHNPSGAWQEGGAKLGTRSLHGATVQVETGVETSSGIVYAPAGSFIISDIRIHEGEDIIVLSGYDALLHRFALPFRDTLAYPCTLKSIFSAIVSQAGCISTGQPACNGNVLINAKPAWGEGCTLRKALAYTAGAMGCFVRLNRQGLLTLVPANPQTSERTLSPERLTSLSLTPGAFVFNRIRIIPRGAEEGEYVESALDSTLPASADNLLTLEDNPLFRAKAPELQTLAGGLCQALRHLTLTAFEGEMPGDPTLQIGDPLLIYDCTGKAHLSILSSQQLTFRAGLTAEMACEADLSGIALPRVFTSGGMLTSAALSDGIISSRHIKAGSVDAEKISARAITAEHIAAGSLTADSGVIADLSADLITSGKLNTDRLIIGGTEFSIVRALNQLANSLSQNDSTIDGSVLSDKSISAIKVTDDFGAGLELSSNAAVLVLAGKLDGTHSHMELTESAINMVGGEINIATDDMQIRGMQDGEEIMSLDPDGLSADRVVVRKVFSAPNVVLKHLQSVIPWRGSIQLSLDSVPRYLACDAVLTLPTGIYHEDVVLQGFCGAGLTLLFSPGTTLIGTVRIKDCGRVTLTADALGHACIHPASAHNTIEAVNTTHLALKNLYISGYHGRTTEQDGSDCAVLVRGGTFNISGCGLEYGVFGARFEDGAAGYAVNNIGGHGECSPSLNSNLRFGLYAGPGSHVAAEGSVPMGGEQAAGAYLGTLLTGDITPTAGGMAYTPPTEYTLAFTPTRHCTYRHNHSFSTHERNAQFSQGRYGDTGWRMATLWFGEAKEALADKTIVHAQLTLRRATGGWSSPVPVYLGTAALLESDYASTFWPAFTQSLTNYPGERIARESEMTYDVTELIHAVQQGFALALYEPEEISSSEWSTAYTQFYGKGSAFEPILTVTYSTALQPEVTIAACDSNSVTLQNATFALLSDGSVQINNAAFTAQDDKSVLVQ